MPKRKQTQNATDGRRGNSKTAKTSESITKPVTLPSLFTLPEEILNLVLSLICSKDVQADFAGSTKWKVNLDHQMMLTLMLVSPDFYDYFKPLAWSHICISKPSALLELHSALLSRPSNGPLVKSLHIGPLTELHKRYWPLRWKDGDDEPTTAESLMLFGTGLTTSDEKIRPRGIWADERIMYDAHEFSGDSYAAKTARTALEAVDIELDPYYGCSDTKHKRIGIIEWTKRVFYAQGALDLCLIKLRELDDARAASRSRAVSYPRLVIEGFDRTTAPETSKRKSKEKKGKNDFIVTPDMIHAHWTRRGAHTDHFDHPLVFAEPGLRYLAQSEADKVIVDPAKAAETRSYLSDNDDEEQASASNAPAEHIAASSSADKREALAVSVPSDSSPTSPHGLLSRRNLLAVGRFIVQQTSKVKNLSLSGLFHGLLSSSNLGELRRLSIGPLVRPDAAAGLLTSGVKLPKLRKLRVCGDHPTIDVARMVAGKEEGLESLDELHWDFGYDNVRNAPADALLFDVLETMRGAVQPAPPSSEEAKDGQHRKAPAEKSTPAASRRYIEARMHPSYVSALLSMVSPETRAAWTSGLPTGDADHCLRLCESRAWEDGKGRCRDHKTQKYDVLRRETRQWWEDCALESQ